MDYISLNTLFSVSKKWKWFCWSMKESSTWNQCILMARKNNCHLKNRWKYCSIHSFLEKKNLTLDRNSIFCMINSLLKCLTIFSQLGGVFDKIPILTLTGNNVVILINRNNLHFIVGGDGLILSGSLFWRHLKCLDK